MNRAFSAVIGLIAVMVAVMGCGGTSELGAGGEAGTGGVAPGPTTGSGGEGSDAIVDPPATTSASRSAEQQEELAALQATLSDVVDFTSADITEQRPTAFDATLGYAPSEADGMELLQASGLSLTDSELELLDANGFVISERQSFSTFHYGYSAIYAEDLPVFISVDSILHALHRSFDQLLEDVEAQALQPLASRMLATMHAGLRSSRASETTRADLDLFLTVARSLLEGGSIAPLLPENEGAVAEFVSAAEQAPASWQQMELFGVQRKIDLSQFKPRGHYTDSEALQRYFRAMMWLGRIDFRLIETQSDGTQLFYRRQVEAAVALRELMDDAAMTDWQAMDGVIGAFMGEHDSMTPPEVDALLQALGVAGSADLAEKSDDEIAAALAKGGFGEQRIMSHVIIKSPDIFAETVPLNVSFLLMGQRYVVDSHVFSNVTYDRVISDPIRALPDSLDVAYAALGNDQAAALLTPQLDRYGYAPQLEATRLLVDAHGDPFWEANLYNRWLGALRELSPGGDAEGLPTVARSEAWGRRMLNAQLASWAELRHDTLLYAKQSYTVGLTCEYPDGYVDPYPEAFQAIAAFAEQGKGVVEQVEAAAPPPAYLDGASSYFERLHSAASLLAEMAEHQRTGTPHTAEHLAFINQTVSVEEGCGDPYAVGWYPGLFYGAADPLEEDPTIADVHTAPDDGGSLSILHVGTGFAQLMVVTVDTCSGPRLYAGPVSSFHEVVDESRLNDEEWSAMLSSESPREVPWMSSIMAPVQ